MEFFTSDTHFYHQAILEYDGRPFRDMGDMLDKMIMLWNRRVQPHDVVYHLGDVAMIRGGKPVYIEYLKELNGYLNGRKVLIKGNHDYNADVMTQCGFSEVYHSLYLTRGPFDLYLVHSPYAPAARAAEKIARLTGLGKHATKVIPDQGNNMPLVKPPEASIVLHGHIHTKGWLMLDQDRRLYVNVGCMRWGYQPRTLEDLLELSPASYVPLAYPRLLSA